MRQWNDISRREGLLCSPLRIFPSLQFPGKLPHGFSLLPRQVLSWVELKGRPPLHWLVSAPVTTSEDPGHGHHSPGTLLWSMVHVPKALHVFCGRTKKLLDGGEWALAWCCRQVPASLPLCYLHNHTHNKELREACFIGQIWFSRAFE
jgi:hypothetical protein